MGLNLKSRPMVAVYGGVALFLLMLCAGLLVLGSNKHGRGEYVANGPTETKVSEDQSSLEEREFLEEGDALLQQREYTQAVEAFNKAMRRGLRTSTVYSLRGRSYYELGRYKEALADASEAMRIQPDDPYPYILTAIINERLGQPEDSIETLTKGIGNVRSSNVARLYATRGLSYLSLKQPEKALDDFARAITLDDRTPSFYYNRGIALNLLGRYEEAIHNFSEALGREPNHYETLLDRAWTYGCLEEYPKAIQDFDRILSVKENDLLVRMLRGWSRLKNKEVEAGLSDLNYALDHGFEDPWLYQNLATGFYGTEQFDKALQANDRAIELLTTQEERKDLNEAESFLQRGLLLFIVGRYEEGHIAYNRGRSAAERISNRVLLENAIGDLRTAVDDRPQIKGMADPILQSLEELRSKILSEGHHQDPELCQRPKRA